MITESAHIRPAKKPRLHYSKGVMTIKDKICKTCDYYERKGQHIGLCKLYIPPIYAWACDKCELWKGDAHESN